MTFPERLRELLIEISKTPSKTVLVFDLDGTLEPISNTLVAERALPKVFGDLKALANAGYAAVVIDTGRAMDQAVQRAGYDHDPKNPVVVMGNHGMEAGVLDKYWKHPAAADVRSVIEAAEKAVGAEPLFSEQGIWVQIKYFTLAVHFSGAPDKEGAVARALAEIVEKLPTVGDASPIFVKGKICHEIHTVLSKGITPDKGSSLLPALQFLLSLEPENIGHVVMAGDEISDAKGMRSLSVLAQQHGFSLHSIGVAGGNRNIGGMAAESSALLGAPEELVKLAEFMVDTPEDVGEMVKFLLDCSRHPGQTAN